jgi:hypothetical protein
MPDRSRVEALIARVVGGDYTGAITDFYHEDASMQENDQPPREGRDVLLEFERKMLERIRMRAHPVDTLLVDGDRAVIQWTFEATDGQGTTRRLTELALQHWRGDRIAREQFFYDTGGAWQVVEE